MMGKHRGWSSGAVPEAQLKVALRVTMASPFPSPPAREPASRRGQIPLGNHCD